MRVGFRDLTLWSFLMASAHGAGLMLVPVFLGTTHEQTTYDVARCAWRAFRATAQISIS